MSGLVSRLKQPLRPAVQYLRGLWPILRRKLGVRSEQWLRVVMEEETRKLIAGLPRSQIDCLEISGDKWKDFGFRNFRIAEYPEYDLCEGALSDRFDLIIAEQVFEHLLWPYRAAKNVYTMLRPGGRFLITTPFLIRLHEHPVDCSRWTETGMRYFLAECGFPLDKIQTGSWGNRDCVIANLRTDRYWQEYIPWRHSLRNDRIFPLCVWALAQRD